MYINGGLWLCVRSHSRAYFNRVLFRFSLTEYFVAAECCHHVCFVRSPKVAAAWLGNPCPVWLVRGLICCSVGSLCLNSLVGVMSPLEAIVVSKVCALAESRKVIPPFMRCKGVLGVLSATSGHRNLRSVGGSKEATPLGRMLPTAIAFFFVARQPEHVFGLNPNLSYIGESGKM